VHSGTNLDSVLGNLRKHALGVRQELGVDRLGIGLWFSESAAIEALRPTNIERIRGELDAMGLVPYTFNGFPQGDFHTAVVKHRVYQPTWWQAERAEYTSHLVQLLDALLEPGKTGSISTLPIAWGSPSPTELQMEQAATRLLDLAGQLHQRFERTGRRIVLAIEPEPGCALTDTASLRHFFENYLSEPRVASGQADIARNHLTLCHDVCHAAVMCEDQVWELEECRRNGIQIGKVQISSAISVPWDELDGPARHEAELQLSEFAEDRYLHQTMIRNRDGTKSLHEDLPQVLRDPSTRSGEWRIHFHVPIYVEAWGQIRTTQHEIKRFLRWLQRGSEAPSSSPDSGNQPHLEVETYAWGVLPPGLRVDSLHLGIARELRWLQQEWL
jgi:hypothetical protein